MTAKEMAEPMVTSVADPTPVWREILGVGDDEVGTGGVVEVIGGIGVAGMLLVKVGEMEAPEVVVKVSLAFPVLISTSVFGRVVVVKVGRTTLAVEVVLTH